MFKKIFFLFLLSVCCLGVIGGIAQAADPPINPNAALGVSEQNTAFKDASGFGGASVGDIASAGIKGFLGLLGVVFIILIILGGFKWMTAQGNEQQVEEAKNYIKRAIIGIIIITAAYAITHFVFNVLEGVTEGGGGGGASIDPL